MRTQPIRQHEPHSPKVFGTGTTEHENLTTEDAEEHGVWVRASPRNSVLSVVRLYFQVRWRPLPARLWLLAVTALAAGLLTAGCGEDRYKGIDKQPVLARDLRPAADPPVGTGSQAVFGADPAPQSLEAAMGADLLPAGGYSRTDLVAKADIYWKLAWIDKSIHRIEIPPDVPGLVDKLLAKARSLTADKNTQLIRTILTALKTGLDARREDLQLRENGIDPNRLSWASGRFTLEQELNRSAGPRPDDTSAHASTHTGANIDQVLKWASSHHAPPAEVMQQSFREAHAHTAELVDSLDEERSLAGVHPLGRDNVTGDPSLR